MGYEREEVLGRRSTDFLTPESRKKAIEKDLPEFFKTGTAWNVPYRMVKKSGEEFDVLLSAVSVTDRNGEFLHSLAVISDVSELSRAERVLQEQEKRFRFLFEAAPLAYQTMDLHQTIRDVNQEWLDSMGYERDEVLGKPFSTFLSPQSRETLTRCFPRLLRSGSERNVELRMVRKDGSELSTLHHGRVVQGDNGSQTLTHCIFVDISERKQAEQARHDSEERLRALLSAIPDMMFLQDAHGRYIDAHAPGLNAYIKDPPDLLGKGMDEVIPLQLAAEVKQQLDGVFREGQPQEKVYAVDLEGKTRHLECRMVPCGEHVLSIVRDVTDRVELEEELRGHEVELARKNHELIEKNIALKELLYQFRQEKERTRTSVADNVEHLLLPLIYRMRSSCRGEESGLAPLLDIFESTVRNMIASPAPAFLNRIEKLTRREAEICNLIRNGLSSKEAARVLGVSTRSIETHRHNIRKKLGITGTRVDLGAYLARL
jgi:PAS domain S-box-containing protein